MYNKSVKFENDADFPFEGKYTFVDVEIPNLNNDTVCAISMIVIEDGREVLRHTELINPRTFFSANNIAIHGIRRKDVADARTMEEFWKEYGSYFGRDYIIAAHNSMSDISVMNKDLARLHKKIGARYYIDTMDIMSDFYFKGRQKKGDLKLNNIARRLGIYLDHHNPESDVNACYEVVRFMQYYHGLEIEPYIKAIPDRSNRSAKTRYKPSPASVRRYLSKVRRNIARKDAATSIHRHEAELEGDKAWRIHDYEGVIFNYEVAIARHTPNITIYLRLAEIYASLNLNHDAQRVLEIGVRRLKKSNSNYYVLRRALSRMKKKRRTDKKEDADPQQENLEEGQS